MSNGVSWVNLNGFQFELLWEAISHDFNETSLGEAVRTKLGKRLDYFVPSNLNFRSQVFKLIERTQQEGWTDQLFDGLRLANPSGPGLRDFAATAGLTAAASTPAPAGWTLESLLRPDKGFLEPDGWLTKLARLRRQVCRIEHPSRPANKPGFGTGWLIGANLMLTNHHVIQEFAPLGSRDSSEVLCRFDVPESGNKVAIGRTCRFSKDWLKASGFPGTGGNANEKTLPALDFAVVSLAEAAAKDQIAPNVLRGRVDLSISTSGAKSGDVLLIVQHPSGLPQRFAFGNVRDVTDDGQRLLHDANTLPGSSGSPIVDVELHVLALHRGGGATNEGVPIKAIADRLAHLDVSLV
jgi:trypsin-like peptidase/effector-associated domain 1 (EAD1)-containing protein